MEFSVFPFSTIKRLWRWFFPPEQQSLFNTSASNKESFLRELNFDDLPTIAMYDGAKSLENPFSQGMIPTVTISLFPTDKKGLDGSMHILTHAGQNKQHLFRMYSRSTTDAKSMYARAKIVCERLREHIVPIHYLSCYEHQMSSAYFFLETDYVNGLRNVKVHLQSIDDPNERAQALLDIVKQIVQMCQRIHKKKLLWVDLKPENLMINPTTNKVCVADTKSFFPSNVRRLPAFAFTKEYTESSLQFSSKIKFNERLNIIPDKYVAKEAYKQQFKFSLLKTLNELHGLCDDQLPQAKAVRDYIDICDRKDKMCSTKYLKIIAPALPAEGSRQKKNKSRGSLMSRVFHRKASSSQAAIAATLESEAEKECVPSRREEIKGPPASRFLS